MAKQAEPQQTLLRCPVCKGKLTDPAYPVCAKPYCYNRTVSMFEGFAKIGEVFKVEGKKGGIPEAPERVEEKNGEEE